MATQSANAGGRPRLIDEADIVRAGRALGMRRLSLNAVAAELDVSATALYRHVEGRWGLEHLVGESLLAELRLRDEGGESVVRHLLSFGLQLRTHMLAHPGLAGYVQTLFPRGESGRCLLSAEIEALGGRGYAPDAALVLCSAVASMAIGYAAAEDVQRERAEGLSAEQEKAAGQLSADARLGEAHRGLPEMDSDTYVRLMLTGAITGLVSVAPPGRPTEEIIAALRAAGEDV